MPRAEYFILADGVKWKIKLGTLEYSFYDTLEEAMAVAIDAAHAAGKSGFEARVGLQTADGSYRPIWTYGLDQYPPR